MKSFLKKRLNALDLKNHVDTIFDNIYDSLNWIKKDTSLDPSIEIKELKKHLVIKIEIPGLKKEDLNIHVDEQQLIIEGEKKQEVKEEDGEFYHYSELVYGSFKRAVQLPKVVDIDHVKASFKDGLLTIRLKKSEETKNRKIDIE